MLTTSHGAPALAAAGADAVWASFVGRASAEIAPHFRPVEAAGD
jgi:hypothetical protein